MDDSALAPVALVAHLSLYIIGSQNHVQQDKHDENIVNHIHDLENHPLQNDSHLDSLILSQWEDLLQRGLSRYDVTACETKVLAGDYGSVAQLNEGRHLKKRPTEFRIDQVLQPTDSSKFNFTKVRLEEVLFQIEAGGQINSQIYHQSSIGGIRSPNVIAINVSPIEYGHVLLIPRVTNCIPQRIDPATLHLALQVAVEVNNPYFRIGHNSLGAFATINHLHFQAYYLSAPFAVERAPTVELHQMRQYGGVRISELFKYPVRGLVYESAETLQELSGIVARACMFLHDSNIPFNVLIADRGARVFLFPQCFAERRARGEVDKSMLDTQVNPAVWEISGHIVLKRQGDYAIATEDYAWKLLAGVSLSEEQFLAIKKACSETAKQFDSSPLSAEMIIKPQPLTRTRVKDECQSSGLSKL